MVEGVSISNADGIILYTNPAEDAMFGYERGELVGQHVSVQNTYPPEENARIVQEVIAQLKAKGSWQGEFANRKKDGTPFTTFARITALTMANGQYWVCVQEDMTQRRATEAALQSSQDRLALAYQAARLGTFDWNIQTNAIVWSREEEALYGLPPGSFGGDYRAWRQAIHPDDREQTEQAVQHAAHTGKDLDTDFRVIWPDGWKRPPQTLTTRAIEAAWPTLGDDSAAARARPGGGGDYARHQRVGPALRHCRPGHGRGAGRATLQSITRSPWRRSP